MADIRILTSTKILLVEDTHSDALLIQEALDHSAPPGAFRVIWVETVQAALEQLGKEHCNIVLLDLSLPDAFGLDGLLSIQNLCPSLPVIILTACQDEALALKAVECGAQDYLLKDKADGIAIERAMRYAMQRKEFERGLIAQANFDKLTGLANRSLFESCLEMAVARTRRLGSGLGLFFLDLDDFKQVNDTLGHSAGDRLLQSVAERLKQCLRVYDTAARFGGDEFAVLVEGIVRSRDCAVIAQKMVECIDKPFQVGREEVKIGVSIGIATSFAKNNESAEMLMRRADEAMYRAKLEPHSHYCFFTAAMQEEIRTRLGLEAELREALHNGELLLHYQPKQTLESSQITGVEALIRWKHSVRGLLMPAEFTPIAEETGLMPALGQWVLKAVCADMRHWQEKGLPMLQVSVNISPSQLDEPDFVASLTAFLQEYGIDPKWLALEVPESVIADKSKQRHGVLAQLHALGIGIHLDHFGSGLISLQALEGIALDALKIAPALTRTLGEAQENARLVRAIIGLAHQLGIQVIASGVENRRQRAFLTEQHCDQAQGFSLGRPMPPSYLPAWLSKKGLASF